MSNIGALQTYRFSHNGQTVEFEGTEEQVTRLKTYVEHKPGTTSEGLPILSREEFVRLTSNTDAGFGQMSQNDLATALDRAVNGGVSMRDSRQVAGRILDAQKSQASTSPNQVRARTLSTLHQIMDGRTDAAAQRTLASLGKTATDDPAGVKLQAAVALIESLDLPNESKITLLQAAQNFRIISDQGKPGKTYKESYDHEINALASLPQGVANNVRSEAKPSSEHGSVGYRFLQAAIDRLR
jgi:hypothetical protein